MGFNCRLQRFEPFMASMTALGCVAFIVFLTSLIVTCIESFDDEYQKTFDFNRHNEFKCIAICVYAMGLVSAIFLTIACLLGQAIFMLPFLINMPFVLGFCLYDLYMRCVETDILLKVGDNLYQVIHTQPAIMINLVILNVIFIPFAFMAALYYFNQLKGLSVGKRDCLDYSDLNRYQANQLIECKKKIKGEMRADTADSSVDTRNQGMRKPIRRLRKPSRSVMTMESYATASPTPVIVRKKHRQDRKRSSLEEMPPQETYASVKKPKLMRKPTSSVMTVRSTPPRPQQRKRRQFVVKVSTDMSLSKKRRK